MICPYLSGADLDGNLVKIECQKHDCQKYMMVQGKDPNNGQDVNRWDCSDNFVPMLLIENSQQQRSTGAAVESFRNEMVKANDAVIKLAAQPQMIGVS